MKRFLFFLLVFVSSRVLTAQPEPGLKFIENKNQWPSEINFAARIPGGNMTLSPGRFNYFFIDNKKIEELHHHDRGSIVESDDPEQEFINGHAVEVTLIGGNTESQLQAFGRSSEYYNFFIGSDPDHWGSKAFGYEGVLYSSIYTGIDLKIYSKGKDMKYDFIVAPNADPSQITMEYNGADKFFLDNGNLTIKTPLAEMTERRPFAFQYIKGKKVEVLSEYVVNDNRMSFHFPQGYDSCYELVIDPLLIFSTYSGSTADNWGSTATPGEHGNLYSAGVTHRYFFRNQFDSTLAGALPVTFGAFQIDYGGMYDIGILKYDSTGSRMLYASYLGGIFTESPHSLLMNANEELIVLGTTSSYNFPTTSGAYDKTYNNGTTDSPLGILYKRGSDIFLSKINRDGSQLLASTYLGGTKNDGLNSSSSILRKNYGDECRGDILSDAAGNIYIASVTESPDFPVSGGFDLVYNDGTTNIPALHYSDGIVVKMNPGLTNIIWSSFIGGALTDASHTIKFDSDHNLFVAGGTTSLDFPGTANGFQSKHTTETATTNSDGWIAKISNDGSTLIQSTYTGTDEFDQIYFLDLNSNDEVYVYGQTKGEMPRSDSIYGMPGGQFLQKFSNDLKSRIYSTTFGVGTEPNISPTAFLVSDCNSIYMSGWGGYLNANYGTWNGYTFGLQVSDDAYQSTTSGSDFYFLVLSNDAKNFAYGTFLGGFTSRTHVDGGTSRFDKEGVVYHAVCSGCSNNGTPNNPPSSDFPTTTNAWSRVNRSRNCNNAAFKFDLTSLKARLNIDGGVTKICLPDKFKFNNLSSGGIIYHWDFGDGTKTSKPDHVSLEHEYLLPGDYIVKLVAYDPATCIISDTASVKVSVYIPAAQVSSDADICGGTAFQLTASGAASYRWYTADGSFESTAERPVVTPHDTITYFVDVLEFSGCMHTEDVKLNVVPDIVPDFEIDRQSSCNVRPVLLIKSLTGDLTPDDQVIFSFGDGMTSDASEVEHFYERDSVYIVKQVAVRGPCTFEKSVEVPVFTMTVPNIITPETKDDKNDLFIIQFGSDDDGVIHTPRDYGFNVSLTIYNRWGERVYHNGQYNYDWSGEDQAAGVYYYEVSVEGHATCKSWIQLLK